MNKPTGKWKCRACQTVWEGGQLYQDSSSTAVKWTCADLTCGGTCDRQEEVRTAKAIYGANGRIVVNDCPFCHRTHYHSLPVGNGQRMADCFQGEYVFDFSKEGMNQ